MDLTLVLSFLLFIPFPWRETKLFTRQVKVQSREKYFNHKIYKGNMPTLVGKNTVLSISFSTDRVFSIFLRKIYGSD